MLYADDANFVAHSEEDFITVRSFVDFDAFGFRIRLRKINLLFTYPPGVPYKSQKYL